MTSRRVEQEGDGKLRRGDVRVSYDVVLSPFVEEVKIDDPRLRSVWGERLFRIVLRAANPPAHAVWSTRITRV